MPKESPCFRQIFFKPVKILLHLYLASLSMLSLIYLFLASSCIPVIKLYKFIVTIVSELTSGGTKSLED